MRHWQKGILVLSVIRLRALATVANCGIHATELSVDHQDFLAK